MLLLIKSTFLIIHFYYYKLKINKTTAIGLWITSMSRLAIKILFLFLLNALALYAAVYFVDGFEVTADWIEFSVVAAIFTLINIFIKPIIKLVLSPLIIITLGAGLFFVNAAMLYFLDFISDSVIINGIMPLLYATIVISIAHFVIGFVVKRAI